MQKKAQYSKKILCFFLSILFKRNKNKMSKGSFVFGKVKLF